MYGEYFCKSDWCVVGESSTGISVYPFDKTGPGIFSILAETGICLDVYCCQVSVQEKDPVGNLSGSLFGVLGF